MNRWSLNDIKNSPVAHLNKHLQQFGKTELLKKNKYGAIKTEVDGIVFDSKKEAKRYKELQILLKVGEISLLELQVPYELNEGGSHSFKYIADFVYLDAKSGQKIVEDVKGFVTKEYRKKKS